MEPRTSLCRNLSLCTITVVIELNGLSPRAGVPAGHAQLDGGRATLGGQGPGKMRPVACLAEISREFELSRAHEFRCRFVSYENTRTLFWHAQRAGRTVQRLS